MMRLLFVFVFLLGLVSCGEDVKKNECPKCEEIKGVGFVYHTDGVFQLPLDCGEIIEGEIIYEGGVINEEAVRYSHPKFKKYKNYTGILKICGEDGSIIEYANYKNGKKEGESFQYGCSLDPIHSWNFFDLFTKPKLTRVDTYKNGKRIKRTTFPCKDYIGSGSTDWERVLKTEKSKNQIKQWHDNGQLAYRTIIVPNRNIRLNERFWDENGNKITGAEFKKITESILSKRRFNEQMGKSIVPFTLIILLIIFFIRRRKKKKLKKTS